MTIITPELIQDWAKMKEDGDTYKAIAEKSEVSTGTVSYHLNPETKLKDRNRAAKRAERISKSLGVGEKRPPHIFAYGARVTDNPYKEIVTAFQEIDTKAGLESFLDENEPLLSLCLLGKPSRLGDIKKAHESFCASFGIAPLKYTTMNGRLFFLCSEDILQRYPISKSSEIYKITDEGLKTLEYFEIISEPDFAKKNLTDSAEKSDGPKSSLESRREEYILSVLKEHPGGLPPGTLAALYGVKKYGEPLPLPYTPYVNKKYSKFSSKLRLLLKSGLIEKEKKSGKELIEQGSSLSGFDRRYANIDELTPQALKILEYVQKNKTITIDSLASTYGFSHTTSSLYLDGLACCGLIVNTSKGHYSLKK